MTASVSRRKASTATAARLLPECRTITHNTSGWALVVACSRFSN
jgi:hypothetical protein